MNELPRTQQENPVKTSPSKLGRVDNATVQMEPKILIVTPITLNIWVCAIIEMKHLSVFVTSRRILASL